MVVLNLGKQHLFTEGLSANASRTMFATSISNISVQRRCNAKAKWAIADGLGLTARVEGLLTKGAMKPDDRPLWFDIYRAFPPISEPKFAKPKPEIKPIRQILYPEDAVRAQFHSSGHGLAAISLISQTETPTKKLIQQYEKLKAEGVPEEELVDKSAQIVGSERQLEAHKEKLIPKNPDSVTSQVFAEADLKNIFKE